MNPISYAGAVVAGRAARDRLAQGLRQYGLRGAVSLRNPTSGRFGPLRTAVVIGEDEGGARLCLKLYEDSDEGRAKLRAQTAYLQALRGRVLAPEVIGCEETAEPFGRPALVMSHLGEPLDYAIDSLSSRERRQIMEDLADTMAALAALSLTDLGLPEVSPEKIRETTAESFAWSTDWYCEHLPDDAERRALVVRGVEVLRGFKPQPREPRLCHQDLAMCNVMVRGGRFSGLIDWDCAGPAPAERDLGSAAVGVLATLLVPQVERLDLLSGLLARYRVRVGEERFAQGWGLALLFALDSLLDWTIGGKNAPREGLVWATSLALEALSKPAASWREPERTP